MSKITSHLDFFFFWPIKKKAMHRKIKAIGDTKIIMWFKSSQNVLAEVITTYLFNEIKRLVKKTHEA